MSNPATNPTLGPGLAPSPPLRDLDDVGAVELPVRIELGQLRLVVEDLLRLDGDSIVELDRRPADPVDLRVGGVLVARGELVSVETPSGPRIGVRLVEIVANPDRPAGT